VVIWYIFSRFGMLYQEKSGNPVGEAIMRVSNTGLIQSQDSGEKRSWKQSVAH
jgi:hypothetical protein